MRIRTPIVLAMMTPSAAVAQPIVVADSGDSAWLLAASVIVLLSALPGLALFHGGARPVRTTFTLFLGVAIASLFFAGVGYSIAYSPGTPILGGGTNIMLANLLDLRPNTTIPESLFALFQMGAAIFAVAILVASVAEQARLGWLLGFTALWTITVYTPVAHWLGGGGWLGQLGALDFAGGIGIQLVAGLSALVIAALLGRRKEGDAGHDPRLALAGVALLWVGWFGLIGGAALGAGDDAATAVLNAQLAASAGALSGFGFERWRTGIVSPLGTGIATVAGLAAVSTGALYVGPAGAMALGVLGAAAASLASLVLARLRLGSAAGAFVAHGSGALVGAIAFPPFVLPVLGGPGFDGTLTIEAQVAAQLVAVLAVGLWTIVVTAIAALACSLAFPMRPDVAGDA